MPLCDKQGRATGLVWKLLSYQWLKSPLNGLPLQLESWIPCLKMLSSVLKCLQILKALWNVFPWQRGELEDLGCGKSRKWSDQRFVEIEPRKGSFNSQMRVRLRGWQIGLEAGEGIRHVIYHFSLGRDEDVTSIHTKEQGCPCCLLNISGVVLFAFLAECHRDLLLHSFSFPGFWNCVFSFLWPYGFNFSFWSPPGWWRPSSSLLIWWPMPIHFHYYTSSR